MRTTLTLDPDVAALVEREVRQRGRPLKAVINDAIRAGLGRRTTGSAATPTFAMGEARIPITKALRLAADLEDEELARRLAVRK